MTQVTIDKRPIFGRPALKILGMDPGTIHLLETARMLPLDYNAVMNNVHLFQDMGAPHIEETDGKVIFKYISAGGWHSADYMNHLIFHTPENVSPNTVCYTLKAGVNDAGEWIQAEGVHQEAHFNSKGVLVGTECHTMATLEGSENRILVGTHDEYQRPVVTSLVLSEDGELERMSEVSFSESFNYRRDIRTLPDGMVIRTDTRDTSQGRSVERRFIRDGLLEMLEITEKGRTNHLSYSYTTKTVHGGPIKVLHSRADSNSTTQYRYHLDGQGMIHQVDLRVAHETQEIEHQNWECMFTR